MLSEDIILKLIVLSHKQNKKLESYMEKISDLILKGRVLLCQLTGQDPGESIVPLTSQEISSLWKDNEYWPRVCSNFLGKISNNCPKSERIKIIRRTSWVLLLIVRKTTIY